MESECGGCKGRLKAVDHVALQYLQYKMNEGLAEELAPRGGMGAGIWGI